MKQRVLILHGLGHYRPRGHGPFPGALSWVLTGQFDPTGF